MLQSLYKKFREVFELDRGAVIIGRLKQVQLDLSDYALQLENEAIRNRKAGDYLLEEAHHATQEAAWIRRIAIKLNGVV